MEDLKPCPFCGCRARLRGDDFWNGYFVRCVGCFVETDYNSTELEAIEAWNRRVD